MKDNKLWYTLKFNGELEKLCNAELYEAVGRFLQYLNAILQIKPELAIAINAYEFLEFLKSISSLVNDKLIKTKYEYQKLEKAMQEAQQQQQEMQAQMAQAQMANTLAGAKKDEAAANVQQNQN